MPGLSPGTVPQPTETAPTGEFDGRLSYRENKERQAEEFEKRYLKWLMQRADNNISRAAREADMDRKYLHKLLKKHNLLTYSRGHVPG